MIQVKYEMLCQVRVDRQPVTLAAKAYGFFTHSYEFWRLSESVMPSLDGCVGLLGDTKLLPLCNGGTCRMFISSVDMNGNLGGLRGADATCQARATAARLPGTYKAWLNDSNESPSTRFTQSTRPYVRVDGQVVANNWDELTSGAIQNVLLDEKGAPGGDTLAWTNTLIDGTAGGMGGANKHCSDWTTSAPGPFANNGNPGLFTDKRWTQNSATACEDTAARLICVQQ